MMPNQFEENAKVSVGGILTPVPRQKKVKKSDYRDSGLSPIIDQSTDFIAGYTDDEDCKYKGQLPVIIFGDHTRILKYVPFRFAAGADGTQILKPNEDFDERYFYYSLKALNLKNYGYERHFKYLKKEEITYRSLSIQRKIAGILSAYDDLIENNTRRIKILEETAQRIYREWFVNFRYPGHENHQLVESELGVIPEGWKVVRLGDIAQEVRRSVDPNDLDPNTPHFGLEHLPRKSIALMNWGYADKVQSTKLAFKKGEILFGKIRPYFHKVGVAPLDGICSTDTIVITCKEPIHKFIVLSCVSSTDFVSHATQTSQGTKMPRANWDVLVEYPVLIPVENVLGSFNEFMQPVVDQIINHIFRNRTLRHTRDLLLPKLISGEIAVSGLDIKTEL